jgi:hypothetical protein
MSRPLVGGAFAATTNGEKIVAMARSSIPENFIGQILESVQIFNSIALALRRGDHHSLG